MIRELPICCHRQYVKGQTENVLCHSPRFVGGKNYITLNFCRDKCHCPNQSCSSSEEPTNQMKRTDKTCIHLGDYTGDTQQCQSCRGKVLVKLHHCHVYRECTTQKAVPGKACCNGIRGEDGFHTPCPHYRTEGEKDDPVTQPTVTVTITPRERKPDPVKGLKWAYGVTTVPDRVGNLLDRTLTSLHNAGFYSPRLFIDGGENPDRYKAMYPGCQVTCREPKIRTHGNWVLSMYELYIRNPLMDRYAIFQDDFVTYPNLKEYLDQCQYPERGYWNLYTMPKNQEICPKDHTGWYLSNQRGLGAVALVFSREAVIALLSGKPLVERVMDKRRGHKAVDGGIVHTMKKQGYKEYVHNPSLVQHTGEKSSMGNGRQPLAESFNGEGFDARELITTTKVLSSV